MALKYGPFNGLENAWDAYDWARYFKRFFGNGVFANPSTGLQVIAHENMQTKIKAGFGFIEGHYIENDSDFVLTHEIADGVLKRIDRIVMRVVFLTNKAELLIKKGTSASTPVVPPLVRNTEYYELVLADVYIANGATEITQANITDQRLNTELCGVVHGTVNQLDTTTLALQYQSAFSQMTAEQQQAFEDWFTNIQVVLDGNIAGNLLNQINELRGDLGSVVGAVNEVERESIEHKDQSASTAHGPVRKEYILFSGALTIGTVMLTMPQGFTTLNDFDEVIISGTMDTTSSSTWKHFSQRIDIKNVENIIGFSEFHEILFAGATTSNKFWLRGDLNRSAKTLSIAYNRRKLGTANGEDTYVNAIGGVVGVKYD